MTYFLSSRLSELPIRRVEVATIYGHKKEPHYEDMTYGHLSCCICLNRVTAVKEGRRYMFFATEYQGLLESYRKRVFIVGYYRLHSFHSKPHYHRHRLARKPCVAVRADRMSFVRINDAFELTDEIWLKWFHVKLPRTPDGRPYVQGIISMVYRRGLHQEVVKEVVDSLTKSTDANREYVHGTQRVSAGNTMKLPC